jgi:hypothetical protein
MPPLKTDLKLISRLVPSDLMEVLHLSRYRGGDRAYLENLKKIQQRIEGASRSQ